MSAADTLKSLQILSDWNDEELELLAGRMQEVEVPGGTALLTEGESALAAFILKSGRLRVMSRGEIVGVVDVVASFGEISCLLPDTPVTATVMAERDSLVYRISKDDLLATGDEVPKLWRAMFAQMTERLKRTNKRLVEVLDHSPQGFLKLDRDAQVTNEYSSKCIEYLGQKPLAGHCLPELLMPDSPEDAASWKSVFSMVFDDVGVPLSDLFDLLTPEARIEAGGVTRDLRFEFHAIYNEAGQVTAVDLGIEDITRERELERAREHERGQQAALGKVYQNPDSFFGLLRLLDQVESSGTVVIGALRAAAESVDTRSLTSQLLRDLHSLKGFAGNFGLVRLRSAVHELETALGSADLDIGGLEADFAELCDASAEGRALRSLIDPSLLQRLEGVVLVPDRLEAMRAAIDVGDLAAAGAILQAAESVDIKQLFACWPADLQRLCIQLGKAARFELYGVGGMVPKPIFMALDRVLVHVLNNAMSHGMEDPETRLCAEKDPEGVVSVMVEVGTEQIGIEIADDGAGIDRAALLEKARANPAVDPAQLEQYEVSGETWRVLLLPGFSTASEVTELAGRGVGLDAVAAAVVELGGSLTIDSTAGRGFALRIAIPLADPVAPQGG